MFLPGQLAEESWLIPSRHDHEGILRDKRPVSQAGSLQQNTSECYSSATQFHKDRVRPLYHLDGQPDPSRWGNSSLLFQHQSVRYCRAATFPFAATRTTFELLFPPESSAPR